MRIAFYGKGGIGKSTIAANVSASLAEAGKRVLHIGCDPKADSARNLCHGKIPTVLSQINRLGNAVTRNDIVFEGAFGVCCVEAGGPQAGVGCAGLGITIMEQTLNQLHILDEGWDVIIYDVLGDVVCGGFAVPVKMHYVDLVYIVTSSDYMALYAANNIIRGIAAFSTDQKSMFGGLIANHCNSSWDQKTVRRFAEKIQGTVIRWMPESNLVKRADFQKKTVLEAYPESNEAEEFRLLARTLYVCKHGTHPVLLSEEILEETLEGVGLEEESMSEVVCAIRTADFRRGCDMTVSLPAKVLEKEGIALLVPGSLACAKAVERVAGALHKKEYFFPIFLTPGQYADGSSGQRIKEKLEQILELSFVRGIVIYASCLEVMFRTDFHAIIPTLTNPQKKPVAVLYRGPLVKRTGNPAVRLQEVIRQVTEGAESNGTKEKYDDAAAGKNVKLPLPSLFPDFHGILATFQQLNVYLCLITPGGCVNGIEEICARNTSYRLKQSRFNDIQLAMGAESLLVNGICQDFEKSAHPVVFFTGSAVPSVAAMDIRQISQRLQSKGVPNLYLPGDGFTPAQIGISHAFLEVGKHFTASPGSPGRGNSSQINILGYSPAIFGSVDKLADGFFLLEKEGFSCYLWGTGQIRDIGESTQAVWNWVISSEGLFLAEWMKSRWGIPYISGIPIGKTAVIHWIEELGRKSEGRYSYREGGRKKKNVKILMIAEPMLAVSIQRFLEIEWPGVQVRIAVYTPSQSLEKWYRQLYPDQEISYFSSSDQLQFLVNTVDGIIADPIYRESVSDRAQTIPWVPLPEPAVSGNAAKKIQYEIFGEKGAVYLEKGLHLKENN